MDHSINCCDAAAYYRQQQSISFAAAAALAAGAALYRHQSKGVTAGESLTSSAATSAPATTASTGTSASTDATAAGSSNSTDAAAATASSDTATTAGTAGAETESSSVSNDEQKTDNASLRTSTDDAGAALDQLLLQLLPFRVLVRVRPLGTFNVVYEIVCDNNVLNAGKLLRSYTRQRQSIASCVLPLLQYTKLQYHTTAQLTSCKRMLMLRHVLLHTKYLRCCTSDVTLNDSSHCVYTHTHVCTHTTDCECKHTAAECTGPTVTA
jgi:hypothetical protein